MKFVILFLLFGSACETFEGRVHRDAGVSQEQESTLNCIRWFHECNCSYSCTTLSAYNGRLENGEANCDVQCDDESIANVPSGDCEDIDGVCLFSGE